jgi:hypothetical protein
MMSIVLEISDCFIWVSLVSMAAERLIVTIFIVTADLRLFLSQIYDKLILNYFKLYLRVIRIVHQDFFTLFIKLSLRIVRIAKQNFFTFFIKIFLYVIRIINKNLFTLFIVLSLWSVTIAKQNLFTLFIDLLLHRAILVDLDVISIMKTVRFLDH